MVELIPSVASLDAGGRPPPDSAAALEDGHLDPAIGQRSRSARPADAAAEDGNAKGRRRPDEHDAEEDDCDTDVGHGWQCVVQESKLHARYEVDKYGRERGRGRRRRPLDHSEPSESKSINESVSQSTVARARGAGTHTPGISREQ